MNIAVIIMTAFIVVSLYWAINVGRGRNESMEQWALGGRAMGTLVTFFLLAGEFFTSFSLTGLVGLGYNSGIAILYIMSYISLGCIVGYFLLPRIRKFGKENNLISQGDFFEKKYNSPFLGKLVTIVGAIAILPIIVMALKGLGLIVSVASYGAVSATTAIWIGTIVVVIYTLISGLKGSSRVAMIKDLLTFCILLFLGIYFPFHFHGGIGPMIKEIAEVKPQVLTFPDSGLSLVWYVSTVVLMTVGFYIWPYTFLSTFAAKSDKALRKNTMLLPLYSLMQLFGCFIAFAAIISIPNLVSPQSDLALIELVLKSFDPWFVGLIGAAGLLAALVPSSIMLITIGSMLTSNIYLALKPDTPAHKQTNIARYFAIGTAILSLYFALNSSGALVVLQLVCYNFITQLFPALIFSLLRKNLVTKEGAISGIIVGITLAIIAAVTGTSVATLFPHLPSYILEINNGLYMVIINIIVMVGVSLITQKSPAKSVELQKTA